MADAENDVTESPPSVQHESYADDEDTCEADDYSVAETDDTASSSLQNAESFKIVAAIDFGTTFSGYAYSFTDECDKIYTNKNWGQTQGFLLHKTPTCLLLRPDAQFEAFGFEAVSKYNDLTEEEADEYFYFDRFKMKLFDNKVNIHFLFCVVFQASLVESCNYMKMIQESAFHFDSF